LSFLILSREDVGTVLPSAAEAETVVPVRAEAATAAVAISEPFIKSRRLLLVIIILSVTGSFRLQLSV
jgi:hypothetical protein